MKKITAYKLDDGTIVEDEDEARREALTTLIRPMLIQAIFPGQEDLFLTVSEYNLAEAMIARPEEFETIISTIINHKEKIEE